MNEIMFAEANPEKIITEMSADYEKLFKEATGKSISLRPADTARLMIATITFAIAHVETLVDHAAKMNLVQTSEGKYLDTLAYGVTAPRKSAAPAYTNIKVYFSTALPASQIIPAGTRVTAGDGLYWATETAESVPAGATNISLRCVCQKPGVIGNGYTAGTITTLVDTSKIKFFASLTNTDTSSGGADEETDDELRERIRIAPESYSTAGPEGAYIYFMKSFDANISDVITISPSPGVVENYIAMKDGYLPSPEYLEAAKQFISAKDKRPMTDNVVVKIPEEVGYAINVSFYVGAENAALETEIKRKVESAVGEYVKWQSSRIGRDIDPSELVRLMKNAGASRVEITSPLYTKLMRGEFNESVQNYDPVQIAKNTQKAVTYGGLTNG